MANLFVKEIVSNKSKKCTIWESEVRNTHIQDKNELFRHMEEIYGRYVRPAVFVLADGRKQKIGWVFEKVERYCQGKRQGTFVKETQVTVHSKKPDVRIRYFYA